MSIAERLAELGVRLPDPVPPGGTYVNVVRTGDLVFTAGHFPIGQDGAIVFGRLGETLDVDAGYSAARLAAASALSSLQDALGSLDAVRRVVRLFGVVNATPDFEQHTRVIDGASDLFVDVFGERGRHARMAVGVASLPAGLALEIDVVVEAG